MIRMKSFWMGRDTQYADELTDEIRSNALETVARANALLERAGLDNITDVNSGWRPRAVNEATANAATHSKHLTGQAIDISDPDRLLARFCCDRRDVLEDIGLWMEDPRWTFSRYGHHWVHVQIVPPPGGNVRIYRPSMAPPGDPDFDVNPQ